jgi:uncharacterized protein (DUF58 family)
VSVRVRPTELGWKALLLLVALEIAFLASSYNNLFFLLIVFCCALGALGVLWSLGNLRGLAVHHLEVPAAAADDTRTLVVELQATGRTVLGLELALLVDDDEVVNIGQLPAVTGSASHVVALTPRRRSLAKVSAVIATSRLPFGLFRARRRLPVEAELITYPRPATIEARAGSAADQIGELASPAGSRGSAVAGLRGFRTGDSMHDVHWKATARRGQPIVRELEPEAEARREVVLDRRCPPPVLEQALAHIACLVEHTKGNKACLIVHSQDAQFSVQGDGASVLQAWRWLAATSPLPSTAAPPPQRAGALLLPATADGDQHG